MITDISKLYTLSLSTGTSLDLQENISQFLSVLMKLTNIEYAAIWLKDPEKKNVDYLLFESPNYTCQSFSLKEELLLQKHILKNKNAIIRQGSPLLKDCFLNETHQTFVAYQLDQRGLLLLGINEELILENDLSESNLGLIHHVIDKLALSIEACITYAQSIREIDAKEAIQKELKESEEKYRTIVKNITEGLLITDLNDNLIFVNKQMSELTGYKTDCFIGAKAYRAFIPEEYWTIYNNKILLGRRGESEQYEIPLKYKNKDTWIASINASPYRNSNGDIIGTITSIINITNRKKIEQAALRNEEKYKSIIENMELGLLEVDTKGQIVKAYPKFCQLTGYNEKELIGKVAIDVFLDKKANLLMNKESEARKLGKSNVYEIQLKKKDGQKIWVLISGAPYYDEENKVVGSVGIHLDITQRKNIAQEVRESKEKLQTILNTSLDAIITINESSIVMDWSPSAEKTFGYSSKEAIGRSLNELIIPKAMRHKRGMSHFMKTGEGPILNKRIELTAVRKSGEVFPIELSVSPIRVQGKYFFSSFCRDITARKENEKALIDAKKTAEQARKVERQFLAHMSHEIRTPMNAVIGMTYLLGQSNLSQEQEDYLEALKFSADSLMGIISDILDLSKIEAGEIELEHRSFSLHHILSSLQKTYQFKVQEKNISVEISIDDRIQNQIIGDETRMSQILGNLLSNASKFTTEGYIGVNAILEKNEEEIWMKFQVYDSGIGISKDNLEIIFDSFKQATRDTHREFGGTGLGLSIVRQLVELQGGKIAVKSELGKGTTFEVLLPFHDSGLPIDNREENTIHSNNIMSRLSTLDILIAEDNLINQKLITSIFSQWGISFDLASDGVEALAYSECKVYDIIFMDINMPRMNGYEVVLAIKADPHNPNFEIPIVTLTAAALNEERKRMFEAGVYDFITKPFSPQQLQQTIVSCLDMSLIIEEESIEHIDSEEDTNQLYDLTHLKQFSQGNPQFLQDMLQMFLEQTPKDLRAIKDGFKDNDWAKVQDLAHQMKSTLGTLGMLKEQKNVQEIEHNMRNKNYALRQNTELIENLISSCENVYHLLEEEKVKLAL